MVCEGCAADRHELCGMQTWCTCDCEGPEGLYDNWDVADLGVPEDWWEWP